MESNEHRLANEVYEEDVRSAENYFKSTLRTKIQAISNTQSEIAKLAEKLAQQQKELKELKYVQPEKTLYTVNQN